MLSEVVRNTVREFQMVHTGDSVGVAVSGGADSVCLLHVLAELASELEIRLRILHLNHGLRGAESDLDAAFVAELASKLELSCEIAHVPDLQSGGDNLEQAARRARLEFFASARDRFHLRCVALGHTRSDQAETVLYRLLRGSGTAGLSGIRPVTSDGRIRPLIRCSRAEVLHYLAEHDLTWRDDHTNADLRFDRNRIRHTLLPLLTAEFSPAVADILAATAEVARAEEEYWAAEIARILPDLARKRLNTMIVSADKLSNIPVALARRVVRGIIAQVRGDLRGIDLAHVERVRQLAIQPDGHGRLQVPGLDIMRSFEWLRVAPPRTETRFQLDYCFPLDLAALPQTFSIRGTEMRVLMESGYPAYNRYWDDLDPDRLQDRMELRNWHPGDELALPGRGPAKIKQFFQEHRIPLWDRHLWPVLTCGKTVVWARRFGVAACCCPDDRTKTVLRIAVADEAPAPETRES